MRYNKDHYSSLKYFGAGAISKFQEIGPGVYFNPYVEVDGKLIKYGVVSVDTLVKDLAKWNSFYLAGRLQKPVKILRDDTMIKYWNQQNLRSAASLAFLNLPQDKPFDEFQFYRNITELSYKGDIRYTLGAENPKKIDNIVEKNFEYFQQYYSPMFDEVTKENKFLLPPGFTKENANKRLHDTIFRSSTQQALKGIFTAGISKSIKYAWAKKMKASGK
jgi:translocator assembly and maintenance protein 41